jgi:hypothetical protein
MPMPCVYPCNAATGLIGTLNVLAWTGVYVFSGALLEETGTIAGDRAEYRSGRGTRTWKEPRALDQPQLRCPRSGMATFRVWGHARKGKGRRTGASRSAPLRFCRRVNCCWACRYRRPATCSLADILIFEADCGLRRIGKTLPVLELLH